MNTKDTKAVSVEDKSNNNESSRHSQIKDDNDKDYDCINDKGNKHPTEETNWS